MPLHTLRFCLYISNIENVPLFFMFPDISSISDIENAFLNSSNPPLIRGWYYVSVRRCFFNCIIVVEGWPTSCGPLPSMREYDKVL